MARASENGKAAHPDEESHEPRECMPCRGTGKLISNLGGTPKDVTCPWCEGAGARLAGMDAQAHWPPTNGEPASQVAGGDPGDAPASKLPGPEPASESS